MQYPVECVYVPTLYALYLTLMEFCCVNTLMGAFVTAGKMQCHLRLVEEACFTSILPWVPRLRWCALTESVRCRSPWGAIADNQHGDMTPYMCGMIARFFLSSRRCNLCRGWVGFHQRCDLRQEQQSRGTWR